MDVRQLRYFLAVAEHRHFTRAAQASFVSQPALSQQIRALERELGAPLFDRLTGGVELTTAGQVLRGYAERILRELENAKVAVEEVVGTVRGELSVSTVHTANLALVVDVLARFREEHPAVAVRIHEERSAEVVESVLSGRVNLGITYLPVAHDALQATPLYEEELVLVLPEGHALAGRTVQLAELAGLPLIVPPDGFCLRAGIDLALSEVGVPPRIVAEMSAPESICEAVRALLGVTLLPRSYMERRGGAGLATARIAPPAPVRTVAAIRRADRHLCLATRAFLAALTGRASCTTAARP
ncbi:MAG TPA: LysR substrate-binding domain-containing protein [Longimicrobiales bacterium]